MESKLPSPPSGDLPPISRADLKALFDYLARPNPPPCSHTLKETEAFLLAHNLQVRETIEWLQRNSGYCDCEVIYNVDAEWGEYAGREPMDDKG
jgi:hypothetical protein